MNAQSILTEFGRHGITLRAEGDKLIAKPLSAVPPELLALARHHKSELLATLATPEPERSRYPERARPPVPLRRCGSLVCRSCHVLSPSQHREDCAFPRFDVCRSRWFWLSAHGAIKCVACAAPPDLALIEAWILARETGEGDDGWRIPNEILSLLHIAWPPQ
jgi:hypothetical protein